MINARAILATSLFISATLSACGSTTGPSTDSQTHWLKPCTQDADCGADSGLSCTCGICTQTCEADDTTRCADTATSSRCVTTDTQAYETICATTSAQASICLPECTQDADCDQDQLCARGACAPAQTLGDSFACGDGTSCQQGQQLCLTTLPGQPGPSTKACEALPSSCQGAQATCACLIQQRPELNASCDQAYTGAIYATLALP